MHLLGIGPMEMLLLMLFGLGGTGLPVGMPPGPEDPLLAKVAPADCTFYLSWAGMAKPAADSKNETERLLAEPEIQQFVGQLDKAIAAFLLNESRNSDELKKAVAQETPKIAKAFLTRPTATFVGKAGFGLKGVEVDGGVVVSTGDATAEIKKSVQRLQELLKNQVKPVKIGEETWTEFPMPEGAPRMVWGFRGKYLILGIGEGSVDNILKRSQGKAPAWLTELRSQLTVPRTSSVLYVNVPRIVDLAAAASRQPQAKAIAGALGLQQVKYFASVTGLDAERCVSRQFVALQGEPAGLFLLAGDTPLTADDLRPIPADSTLAAAARFNPEKAYSDLVATVGELSHQAQAELKRDVEQAEKELELSLVDDILKPLGDSWRIYNSPGEGGLLFTGLTAVVSIKDRARIEKTLERIETVAQQDAKRAANGGDGGFRPRYETVDHFDFAGQKVYYINFVGEWSPFAPAWCVTERELVISLTPANIKALLSRDKRFQSLADVPIARDAVGGSDAPIALAYHNTPELFKLAYPIVQIAAQLIVSQAQHGGADITIPAFPSAVSVLRHMQPTVSTVTRTKEGLTLTTRQTLPLSGAAPVFPLLTLPWLGLRF